MVSALRMERTYAPDDPGRLDDPEWMQRQIDELVEIAVQAHAQMGQPKMAIAQAVRHRFGDCDEATRRMIRQRAVKAWEGIPSKRADAWASGPEFDRVRAERTRRREASRSAVTQPQQRWVTERAENDNGTAFAPVQSLRVVVDGPWGHLGVDIVRERDGRVRLSGVMREADANDLLEMLLQRPDSRLITSRLGDVRW